uniref:Uncharacterized protein n=1 Tax=Phlebotomus papatasi TaxID=29031 RepID=A0A1B0GPX9_PHLPP
MKYSVLIFLICIVTVFGQNYMGLGRITPGTTFLGFADNSTTVTLFQQKHTVRVSFEGTPGSVITFVHVNVFPDSNGRSYTVPGNHHTFWVELSLTNTNHLGANILVYGFPAALTARVNKPIENPKIVNVTLEEL